MTQGQKAPTALQARLTAGRAASTELQRTSSRLLRASDGLLARCSDRRAHRSGDLVVAGCQRCGATHTGSVLETLPFLRVHPHDCQS